MDNLVEQLQQQRAELLAEVLAPPTAQVASAEGLETTEKRVLRLKQLCEELELVAAAATPVDPAVTSSNPNPAVLTAEFYASYLLIVLISKNLNDARFLWKRIDTETKQRSEELSSVWEIGKALWERNFTNAYAAMNRTWSPAVANLVAVLRTSTRTSAAELLSLAYSSISFDDAGHALGFERPEELCQYCTSLNWEVSSADRVILPKPLAHARRGGSTTVDLHQLDTLSKSVLHLEQNTVLKLP